jgi:hypothetical protein
MYSIDLDQYSRARVQDFLHEAERDRLAGTATAKGHSRKVGTAGICAAVLYVKRGIASLPLGKGLRCAFIRLEAILGRAPST